MGREEWKCCGENVIGKSSNRERGEGNGEGGWEAEKGKSGKERRSSPYSFLQVGGAYT